MGNRRSSKRAPLIHRRLRDSAVQDNKPAQNTLLLNKLGLDPVLLRDTLSPPSGEARVLKYPAVMTDVAGGYHGFIGRLDVDKDKKLNLMFVLWARTPSGKEANEAVLELGLSPLPRRKGKAGLADAEYAVDKIIIFGKTFVPHDRTHLESLLGTVRAMVQSASKRHHPDPKDVAKLFGFTHSAIKPHDEIFPGILANGTARFRADTDAMKTLKVFAEFIPSLTGTDAYDLKETVRHTVSFFDEKTGSDKNFSVERYMDKHKNIRHRIYGWEIINGKPKEFTLANAVYSVAREPLSDDELQRKGARYKPVSLYFNGKKQDLNNQAIVSRVIKVMAKASHDIRRHEVPDWTQLTRRFDLNNVNSPLDDLGRTTGKPATYFIPLGGNNANAPYPYMRGIGGNAHILVSDDGKGNPPTILQIDDGMFLSNKGVSGYDSVITHPIEQLDAKLFTHIHVDHTGGFADKYKAGYNHNTPIYADRVTQQGLRKQLNNSGVRVGEIDSTVNFKVFYEQKPFRIGNFDITPFKTDHSAQAYSFHIRDRASGVRVNFHSDLRGHMLQNKADVTLVEGTYADVENKKIITEEQTFESLYGIFQANSDKHILVAQTSGQDERLLTTCRAAAALGLPVVVTGKTNVDMYQRLDRGGIYDPAMAAKLLEYHRNTPPQPRGKNEDKPDYPVTLEGDRLRECHITLCALESRKPKTYDIKIDALQNGHVPLRQYVMMKFGGLVLSHMHKETIEYNAIKSGPYVEDFAGTQHEMNTRLEKETSQTAKDLYNPAASAIVVAQTPFHDGNRHEYKRMVYSLDALGFATYHPEHEHDAMRLAHASGHFTAEQLVGELKKMPYNTNYIVTHTNNVEKAADLVESVNAIDDGKRVAYRLDNGNVLRINKKSPRSKATIQQVGFWHPGFQGIKYLRPEGKYWPAPADAYYEQNLFSFGYNYAGRFLKAAEAYLDKHGSRYRDKANAGKRRLHEPLMRDMSAKLDDFAQSATYADTIDTLRASGFERIAAYDIEATDKIPTAWIRSLSLGGYDLEGNEIKAFRLKQAIPDDVVIAYDAQRVIGEPITEFAKGLHPRQFALEVENAFKNIKREEKDKSKKILLHGYNNKHYDRKVLQTMFHRAGYTNMSVNQSAYSKEYDTYQLALMYFAARNISLPNYKLTTVAEYFGVKIDGKEYNAAEAHDDVYDRKATNGVFEAIRQSGPEIFNFWIDHTASKVKLRNYLIGHRKGFESPRPIVTVCKMEKVVDDQGNTVRYQPTYKLAALICLDLDNGSNRQALMMDISSPAADYNKVVEYAKMDQDALFNVMRDKSPDNPFLRVDLDQAIILPGAVAGRMGVAPHMPVDTMNAVKDIWYTNKQATDNAQKAFQRLLRFNRERPQEKTSVDSYIWDQPKDRYEELDYNHDRKIMNEFVRPFAKSYSMGLEGQDAKFGGEFREIIQDDGIKVLERLPAGNKEYKYYARFLSQLESQVLKTPKYRAVVGSILFHYMPDAITDKTDLAHKMSEFQQLALYGDPKHPGVVPWATIPSEKMRVQQAIRNKETTKKEAKPYLDYLKNKEAMFPQTDIHRTETALRKTVAHEVRKKSYRRMNGPL